MSELPLNLYTRGKVSDSMTWTRHDPLAPGEVNVQWTCVGSNADGSRLLGGSQSKGLWMSDNSGSDWDKITYFDDSNIWLSIASDNDGTNLLAGTYYNSNGRIYISTNSGVTWAEVRPAGDVSREWKTVASDADGSNLIAFGAVGIAGPGRLWISSDYGSSWSETRPLGDNNIYWSSVSSDDDGSTLVVCQATPGGGGEVYVSTNSGTNWNAVAPEAGQWYGCASSSDGTRLIAGEMSGGGFSGGVYISSNSGTNWNLSLNISALAVASSYDGSVLLAVSAAATYLSVDYGVNWTDLGIGYCYAIAIGTNGHTAIHGDYPGGIWTGTVTDDDRLMYQFYGEKFIPGLTSSTDLGSSIKRYKDLYLSGSAKFRDSDIYITSDEDGYMDLYADTMIRFHSPTSVANTINTVLYEDEVVSLDNDMVFS